MTVGLAGIEEVSTSRHMYVISKNNNLPLIAVVDTVNVATSREEGATVPYETAECFKQHAELKSKSGKKAKFDNFKAAFRAPSLCTISNDSDSEENESNTDSDSDAGLRLANEQLKSKSEIKTLNCSTHVVETKTKDQIVRLVEKDGVLLIKQLKKYKTLQNTQNTVAPGVARLLRDTNTQQWHQRLGHTSLQSFKKTAQILLGMEGIDFADLTTCEACYLSKAQRFVSREPRPIAGEPLDEISIDTAGKLTVSINGYQYAAIITDAKTRMRWVITTQGRNVIAEQLVKWIEFQQHQYNTKIRIIFRDGGTEFSRIREYCEKHHIRTDTSAPYTPE
ncbi:hypothetical protein EPUL_004658 [Erysiphe pulchra]|uniref:Integrase catalytic domain-containing protein n=1 Tax=Erysiphe pulchra TaxID=225359 RepID=A0A2S4PSD6_9PEZI|nr:hypothetical protein EPUL_004658 [Erysiphe pulchra]